MTSPTGSTGSAPARPALAALRVRLLEVARRRVEPDAAEDVVQDALRIVTERGVTLPGGALVDGVPPLAWCLTVLRNAIGNHYQKERRRRARLEPGDPPGAAADPTPGPIEAVASREAVRLIRGALADLAGRDGQCGRYLAALARGTAPRRLARQEGLEEAVLYRRVYRCRRKLRELLHAKGVDA